MLADSPRNRLIVRSIITLFGLYGPLCLVYTILAVLARHRPGLAFGYDSLLGNPLLLSISVPEAGFYLFSLVHALYIQAAATHPPLRRRDERMRLFDKVRAEVHDFESFLLGWFSGAKHEQIGRDEVRRWIDWAFWEGRAAEAKETGEDEEIDRYVQTIEKLLGKPFQAQSGKAKALRLTLDPIVTEPR